MSEQAVDMNWGTELWDKYDVICNQSDHSIEFVKRISNFMKDRANVEQNYAKELRQLVKKYTKKEEPDSRYTSVRAFAKIVAETNDLAGQREITTERVKAELVDTLKILARDLTNDRRKIMADGREELQRMKNQVLELERLKQKYDKSCEELETARQQFEKADSDPNMTRAKIEKFNNTVRQKETACEEAKNTYWLFLESTNKFQQKHYEADMPAVFTRFQEMEVSRMRCMADKVKVFADCQRGVMSIVGKCLDNMDAAANAINPGTDCQVLVEAHKSGFSPPGDLEFQEWGKQAVKKSTHANLFASRGPKAEPKEDFSHLPPAQQKKSLKAKVHELEAAVQKSVSDKNAMEKMISIYRQNPALGDEKQVSQSLEETLIKVDEKNGELYKFKCYLYKVEGKGEPGKPQFVSNRPPPLFSFDSLNKTLEPPPQPKKTSPPVKSTPAKPPPPKELSPAKNTAEDEFEDDEEDDEEDDDGAEGKGTVLYDFSGQNQDELNVSQNDRVTILQNLGDGWLRVKKEDAKEGYVPATYVDID